MRGCAVTTRTVDCCEKYDSNIIETTLTNREKIFYKRLLLMFLLYVVILNKYCDVLPSCTILLNMIDSLAAIHANGSTGISQNALSFVYQAECYAAINTFQCNYPCNSICTFT